MAMDRLLNVPTRFLISNFEFLISQQNPKSKNLIIYALAEHFTKKSEQLKLTDFLQYVIKNIGFEEYVRDGTERGEERWDNVRELFSVSLKYQDLPAREAILRLLEEAALAQDTDGMMYEKDLVNLMTLHSAKGLEFSVVFIAGCEQGLLPHSKALIGIREDELREERRLCYVGITRAKEKLYLLFARQRTLFGKTQSNPPSEFLQHIPEHLVHYTSYDQNEESVIEL
jgi:DNA helicase-2/ATP-dependent DNA helicase PcrA